MYDFQDAQKYKFFLFPLRDMEQQSNQLTDKAFWTSYWESKPDLVLSVDREFLFYKQLKQVIDQNHPKTAIELGGFPGHYAIFLKKYFGIQTTLFDYFIHRGILQKVLEKNNLGQTDIHVIEADVFQYTPQEQYDLVLSCGLIEHFQDTRDILQRHIRFLKPGGTLWITLPNFKGVNGWIQKVFDPANYQKHNIHCMDLELLTSISYELGLVAVQVKYIQRFSVWLENKQEKPFLTKIFVKTIWYVGKVLTKLVPFESKLLSPYILLQARKRD